MKSLIRGVIKWLLMGPFRAVAPLLPASVIYVMGRLGGMLYCAVAKARGEIIERNLEKLMGSSRVDAKEVARRSFVNYIMSEFEVFLYKRLGSRNIGRFVEAEGLVHLDDALKLKKGVVLLHAHFGNEHMLMPGLGHRGYKINQVGLASGDAVANIEKVLNRKSDGLMMSWFRLKGECEKYLPANFIFLNNQMRAALKVLEKNEILAISMDGMGQNMTEVRFFNIDAEFMTGPVRIALMAGSPIVPVFMVRKKNGRHRLIIEPPLSGIKTVEDGVKAFAALLEDYMRKYPCHYARLLGYGQPPFGKLN
ncbi:MAG: lysophospholipid acyltransferase family protein [Deltaproteobacteria bacterium]|nr:lysophospholipid acyltransferase family protein [Deltaproteobacteria bacterium]